MKSLISGLENIIHSEDDSFLDELYAEIINHNPVQQFISLSGLKPKKEDFKKYFERTLRGLKYNQENYGDSAVPSKIAFHAGSHPGFKNNVYDWIAYSPEEDAIGVSFLHAARQVSYYGRPDLSFSDTRFPKGTGVLAEDYTTLQAIEEGYHKFQIAKSGTIECTAGNWEHPREKEISGVFEKAIRDLGIELNKLLSKGSYLG